MEERCDRINENLTIIQKSGGLTFGTDAFLLYAYIPLEKKYKKAADLGAGTGVISFLALKKDKVGFCYDIEIQEDYCDLINRNAVENRLEDRLLVINKDVRDVSASDTSGVCDCVFSNPPYMRSGSGFHNASGEKNIARREIHGDITDFCRAAAKLLKFGGSFFVVYRPDRLSELFFAMTSNGIEPKRLTLVYPDKFSPPSLALCEGISGGSRGLFVSRGLFIYDDKKSPDKTETDDIKNVYSRGAFDDSFRKA
ncbi:MAG: methyltransferase [Clostridia bacterium]|nr:methyltransferase [Clostridia bacterium]